ncbi:CDP-diacylglycerol--glycerol-3-phosphate 3-phosphatidyltransferase [Gordonia sp. HNM0687]|uniref:CDP-diacylglycerol--glycerol-3-phosphate 3-phosphatidyltransferase n=1 Tax=Gordonia mangrovi TaxID=2665643 RepID=A0A6L7GR19_9ACTN|nr:CDP-diacylglycerol--glycerol-3-phosphate 3-phosphatidyltransferase [Gordonia mangrovi]MXP22389.1 CDP-diacylglycerol--glycerol-3-phosphate 3-phosphatidyltransferase [Gordonia mangrovi]UVF77726.1 CDP-diacylglycerol--glycerol-3-phosphate 3-phosphatidyltransferase [Gordonia mangrovi]
MTDRVRRAVEESGGLANAGRGPDHITDPVDPVPVVNIANALTVVRIILVPVFIVALFMAGGHDTGWRIAAAVIFGIAAITDRYDGRLARERGLVTDFGKLADPIADKALIGSALVGLSILGDLSWWVTAVILTRELGVTALRFWVLRHGVIPASRGGKLKTLLQAVAIGLYLLPLAGVWHVVAAVIMGVAVVVTVLTGGDYVWQALVLRRRSLRQTGPGRVTAGD